MKNRPSILPVILLLLAGCNLPVTDGPDAAPQGITPTGGIFLVSVSAATDFRAGPGEMYDSLGILNPGQTFEAIGQTSDGEYLLIRDPAQPAMLFWISNDFVILDEDPSGLPIATPPATPTPLVDPGAVGSCPTPVGGGPTPVSCGSPPPPTGSGCPTPVGGGPTPVSCGSAPPPTGSGCPTPVGGGPTPVSCPTQVK